MRFRREALAATVLRHPNIVACLETGTDDGQPFLVMELIEGEDLAARLRRGGRLAPVEAARIGLDVARALGVAHVRGIVHRDVKPGNILLARDGRAMVTDFGIARLAADAEGAVPGTTLGSVHYFSPEQATGRDDDARLRCLQPGPRPVRIADRPARLERRHDRRPGSRPDRQPGTVGTGHPPGGPVDARRDRRAGARPGSPPALPERERVLGAGDRDRHARPVQPDGRRRHGHACRGLGLGLGRGAGRRGRCGRHRTWRVGRRRVGVRGGRGGP